MLREKKIGVLLGGISSEREVSLRSGMAVFKSLKNMGYNVVAIDAGRDICKRLIEEKIEIAFIALHGGWGEDGAIQGLLEVMGIPYTGSGVLASALSMDKIASKKIFLSSRINVPRFEVLTEGIQPTLGFPMVIKPSKEGSSIGVSIVKDKDSLPDALKRAFQYGPVVIAEEYIRGRECQIGILNNKVLGGVEVRTSLEFYNYEAKYTPGLTEYIIPPEIESDIYERVKETALRAHISLGCSGATRVDLIVDEKGTPYVLEVNTIPGMTETSLLPKIARASGLEFGSLIEEILKDSLKRCM